MEQEKLTGWIKAGYPYLKEGAGLASWVLPQHGLNRTVDEVGASGIQRVSQPLGLMERVEEQLEAAPDPTSVSAEDWQDAVRKWAPHSQVGAVVSAFLEVAGPVLAACQRGGSGIDPMEICRSLAVLLYAPFIEEGRALLAELAEASNRPAGAPADLIRGYAEAVTKGDTATVGKVDQIVVKYRSWWEWATALQEQVLSCGHISRLIAVTPPLSAGLLNVLATLLKEGANECRRDNPEPAEDKVSTQ